MAETQDATTGYFGEFWLSSDETSGNLYELAQVREFDIPTKGKREQVEKTHLKSPDWEREFISTFYETKDFQVVLNSRPLSTTHVNIAGALADGEIKAFKAVIPENGLPVAQAEGTLRVIDYDPGRVNDGLLVATVTCRLVSVTAVVVYDAP